MMQTFTHSATRLAAHTALILGWRPHEFWAATPAELATIFAVLAGDNATPPDTGTLAQLLEIFPDG